MDLRETFAELFPISGPTYSLEFVPETVDDNTGEILGGVHDASSGHWVATLRTIGWDVEDDVRSIRDIREQQVLVLPAKHADDPRLPAYFEGWAAALRFVFERHAELRALGVLPGDVSDRLETAMPHELVCPDVLDLRRPQTADEFMDALLSSKKRLGRFVP